MQLFKLVMACGLAGLAVPAVAAPTVWINDSNANLAKVNAVTGVATVVGNTGQVLTDIAFDSAGDLFGSSETTLYRIDKTTAALTEIGSFGDGITVSGLGFDAKDRLYAVGGAGGGGDGVWSIDTANAQSTLLGSTTFPVSDLAVQSGKIYVLGGGSSSDRLYRLGLNPPLSSVLLGATGKINLDGLINGGNGKLYAVGFKTIYRINVAGASTAISTNYTYAGAGAALGAASDSVVPETAGWALMCIGFAVVGCAARRRRLPQPILA